MRAFTALVATLFPAAAAQATIRVRGAARRFTLELPGRDAPLVLRTAERGTHKVSR